MFAVSTVAQKAFRLVERISVKNMAILKSSEAAVFLNITA